MWKARNAGNTSAADASTPFVLTSFWVQYECRLWVRRAHNLINNPEKTNAKSILFDVNICYKLIHLKFLVSTLICLCLILNCIISRLVPVDFYVCQFLKYAFLMRSWHLLASETSGILVEGRVQFKR